MRRTPAVLAVFLFVLSGVLLSGCVQDGQQGTSQEEQAWNETNYPPEYSSESSEYYLYFYAPEELPDAVVGIPYNYSFCGPAPTNVNDLCGALEDSTNPSGGNHPYHFTLGPGAGFQQFGLMLNLNGLLMGTPTAAGTRTFNVCAVDLSGNQDCRNVTLTVVPSYDLSVHLAGTGSGTVSVVNALDYTNTVYTNCSKDCTQSFKNDTWVSIISTPDDGSAFSGWSGACMQTAPYWGLECSITMDGNKDTTAVFDKLGLAVTSVTCSYNTEGGYNYLVTMQGTATGPAGARASLDMMGGQSGSGFFDKSSDCSTWTGELFGCKNNGAYGTTQWSWSYKIYSQNPFTYTPSVGLSAPYSKHLAVPITVSCR